MSTCSMSSAPEAEAEAGTAMQTASTGELSNTLPGKPTGKRLAVALLALASIGLGGCAAPYYPNGVVYSPVPGPSGSSATYPSQAQADNAQPQVVHSVQVPQASLPANGGFSVAEIIAQAKGGRPLPELAADVRARGLNAPLKQADVDMMATSGVPKEVVDAALAAPVNTATVENPQVVNRAYYYYPWVPLALGMYWGAWRPFHYPYYSYSPRYYMPRAPRAPSFFFGGGMRSLPPSGWGGRGGRRR